MRAALVVLVLAIAATAAAAGGPPTWATVRTPAGREAHAIGTYGAGCLAGATRLPLRGDGFRVMQPERRRYFAHPQLAAFLRELGTDVKARGLGVLPLGDLSQARGGPAPTGHSSHQTGLDVDIWYAIGGPRRRPAPISMVGADGAPTAAWGSTQAAVLALAAADPRVDRIFVNPSLKRALCEGATGDRGWLHKLRPWWGHDDHFHLRLACPAADPECQAQPPIAAGDGCAEIEWWLSEKAQEERAEQRKAYRARVGSSPALPASCAALLE